MTINLAGVQGRYGGRARVIRDIVGALVALRSGRWTIAELAEQLALQVRAAYRLVGALRAAGVDIEVEHQKDGAGPGRGTAYYRISAASLRRLLSL